MTFLNSVTFNDSNKSAGLPLTGRLAHLSVPLGLVCAGRTSYYPKRNFEMNEVICESDFDKLTDRVQRKNKTISARNTPSSSKLTKKKQLKLN
jgi:hypothetical protein